MNAQNIGNLKLKDTTAENNNDNDIQDISESLNAPNWNFYSNAARNAHTKIISRTVNFDFRVIAKSLESLASQVKMHTKRNILPEKHNKIISGAIKKIQKDVSNGTLELSEHSSVYDYIQARIEEMCGESAEWFNYILSKPSQLSGDISMLIRDNLNAIDASLQNLLSILLDRAEENVKTIFPSKTNNQLTQPTSFALHLMSYVETFNRDRKRLANCRSNNNTSPYCSGESSGTLQNINRDVVARNLGFITANPNSINSINSYDSALEFGTTLSILAVTLSRFASEMSDWNGPSQRFISFSNDIAQQHNVLPYHRETKSLDFIVAESAKVYSSANAITSTLHSKHLSFSDSYTDLVEYICSAHDSVLKSINAMTAMVTDFTVNRKVTKEAASRDFSTSVDLMNWLMKNLSLSPNQATDLTREIVDFAIAKGKKLSLLELSELKSLHKGITDDIYSSLIPSRAMISRRSGNGSNPVQIRKAIRAAKRDYL